MNLDEIKLIWAVVSHGLPAIEAAWSAAKPTLATEKEDVQAAVVALEKAITDAKAIIPIIETAIKAAVDPSRVGTPTVVDSSAFTPPAAA